MEVVVRLKSLLSLHCSHEWGPESSQCDCSELISYLEKHQAEIINYNRRSRAGKTIGSGQMEKGVDLAVGRRQKHKAMSWRRVW